MSKYTAYYTLNTRQPLRYMTVDGWHVNATDKQDVTAHAQWFLVEQTDDTTIRLRGAEKEGRYFNFDRQTAGSFVYSDKTAPAEFEVIRQSQMQNLVGIQDVKDGNVNGDENQYDLSGRPVVQPRPHQVIIAGSKKRTY